MTRDELLGLARQILSIPTAPYHEHGVSEVISRTCRAHGLVAVPDAVGNLVVRYRSRRRHAPLVMVAHMDHPGFEALGGTAAEFLGGVPPEMFRRAMIRFHTAGGAVIKKRVRRLDRDTWPKRKLVELVDGRGLARGDFGMWDLPLVRVRGDRLHATAIDDLLSVVTVLATLIDLKRSRAAAHAWGVFTRAEEVGAHGARSIAKQRIIPTSAAIISMEMSSERSWARIGHGPVIRIGDRLSVFNPDIAGFLVGTAQDLAGTGAGDRSFPFQRALMDGGICEATIFGALGYRAAGLCLPLGNYHNIGRDRRPQMEYVSIGDLQGLVRLTTVAARKWLGMTAAAAASRRKLLRASRDLPRRLRAVPAVVIAGIWLALTLGAGAAEMSAEELARTQFEFGVKLAGEGKYLSAADAFERAVKVAPGFYEAQVNWAVALVELGQETKHAKLQLHRLQEATSRLEQAVKIRPDDSLAYRLWAETLVRIGDLPLDAATRLACYVGAAEKYKRARELAPGDWRLANQWGLLLLDRLAEFTTDEQARRQIEEEAAELFSQAYEAAAYRRDRATALRHWGRALVARGRHTAEVESRVEYLERACDRFRQATELIDSDAGIYADWGGALMEYGQLRESRTDCRLAIEKVQQAIKLDQEDPHLVYLLARAYAVSGDELFAIQILRRLLAFEDTGHKLIESVPEDPDLRVLERHLEYDRLRRELP